MPTFTSVLRKIHRDFPQSLDLKPRSWGRSPSSFNSGVRDFVLLFFLQLHAKHVLFRGREFRAGETLNPNPETLNPNPKA